MRALRRRDRSKDARGEVERPGVEPARVEALETRVAHLEAALEDLQDAIYRQAVGHDQDLRELRERTRPDQIARDLSEDARKRGL